MRFYLIIILGVFYTNYGLLEMLSDVRINPQPKIRITLNLENSYTGSIRESLEIIKKKSDTILVNRYGCSEKRMTCFTEYFESGGIKMFGKPDSLIITKKIALGNNYWEKLNQFLTVTQTIANPIESFSLSKNQSWIYFETEGNSWYTIKNEYFDKYAELINLFSQE